MIWIKRLVRVGHRWDWVGGWGIFFTHFTAGSWIGVVTGTITTTSAATIPEPTVKTGLGPVWDR
jgi:hypothetical protein